MEAVSSSETMYRATLNYVLEFGDDPVNWKAFYINTKKKFGNLEILPKDVGVGAEKEKLSLYHCSCHLHAWSTHSLQTKFWKPCHGGVTVISDIEEMPSPPTRHGVMAV
jgi:hypothetical protein